MRNQLFGLSLVLAAAACGGDGGDGGKVMVMPDAKIFMDAPPVTTPPCTVMPTFQALSLGTMQMPAAAGDRFYTPTMGGNMGKVTFILGAGLPGSTQTAADALFIEVVEPTGGFMTNMAYNFNPDPLATYAAAAYIVEDLNQSVMPPTYTRLLYASTGSVTFTAIGKTNGSMTNGTVATSNFREVNEMTGADVGGGCTSTIMGLSFYTSHTGPLTREGTDIKLSAEQMAALSQQFEIIKNAH